MGAKLTEISFSPKVTRETMQRSSKSSYNADCLVIDAENKIVDDAAFEIIFGAEIIDHPGTIKLRQELAGIPKT